MLFDGYLLVLADDSFFDDFYKNSFFGHDANAHLLKDVAFGLDWVLRYADTAEKQDAAADALIFKTDVLWSQLDALYSAYVEPGRVPPGGWDGKEGVTGND